jgi:hypothetical protein
LEKILPTHSSWNQSADQILKSFLQKQIEHTVKRV